MTATLVTVAEAVKTDLALGPTIDVNGVATSTSHLDPRIAHSLAVERMYIARFRPPDQGTGVYQVVVSPGGEETERLDRRAIKATYYVEIGICGKLADPNDEAEVDAALNVLQQMGDYFFDFGLTGGAAEWQRNDVIVWPDRERLQQDGALFALWVAVFVGARSKPS